MKHNATITLLTGLFFASCASYALAKKTCRYPEKPKVTIITSVYNGDLFIEDFLKDITKQTIFDQCELLLINANSPANETPVIEKYCALFANITYIRLNFDPGLYGVWNLGVKLARSEYLTNANIDDRLAPTACQDLAQELDNHPEIDLVYSDHYISYVPNEDFARAQAQNNVVWNYPEFSTQTNESCCLGGSHPMWRFRMHMKAGLFDETFKSAGDWEMLVRAGRSGSIFKRLPKNLGVFYINQAGLSNQTDHRLEINRVEQMHGIHHRW